MCPQNTLAVGLVYHKHVTDLHDPGLNCLNAVADARHEHDHRNVHRLTTSSSAWTTLTVSTITTSNPPRPVIATASTAARESPPSSHASPSADYTPWPPGPPHPDPVARAPPPENGLDRSINLIPIFFPCFREVQRRVLFPLQRRTVIPVTARTRKDRFHKLASVITPFDEGNGGYQGGCPLKFFINHPAVDIQFRAGSPPVKLFVSASRLESRHPEN